MPPFKYGVRAEHKPGGYPRMGCGPQRNKLVHVLVAEGMLGRPLRRDEHIHHKDGDTKNPHWTNLLVLDASTHGAVSSRQYWYLKQKYAREDAAWRAFFDVTGKTYAEYESPILAEAHTSAVT
jgi:hypothetical protein